MWLESRLLPCQACQAYRAEYYAHVRSISCLVLQAPTYCTPCTAPYCSPVLTRCSLGALSKASMLHSRPDAVSHAQKLGAYIVFISMLNGQYKTQLYSCNPSYRESNRCKTFPRLSVSPPLTLPHSNHPIRPHIHFQRILLLRLNPPLGRSPTHSLNRILTPLPAIRSIRSRHGRRCRRSPAFNCPPATRSPVPIPIAIATPRSSRWSPSRPRGCHVAQFNHSRTGDWVPISIPNPIPVANVDRILNSSV